MITEMNLIKERGRLKVADKFYLAYGSNLSIEQMKVRTPDAEIVGTAMLEGWRLLFRQYATIKKSGTYKTPVLVWKISEQDEKNLDRYEGFPKFYRKKNLTVAVTALDGKFLGDITAMVYIMTANAVHLRKSNPNPSSHYFSILYEGYETFGFDKQILKTALFENFSPYDSAKLSR